MGQVLNPLLLGLERTQDLYRACTLCGACKEVCPAGVDHPSMFLYYRSKDVRGDGKLKGKKRGWKEVSIFKLFTLASTLPWLWNMGVRLLRPFYNRNAENGVVAHVSGPFEGWFRTRNLPAIPSKTFHERWKNIREKKSS
jgi:L-lactate dehydrogenase complex protein LldF